MKRIQTRSETTGVGLRGRLGWRALATTFACTLVMSCGTEPNHQENKAEDELISFPDLLEGVFQWREIVLSVPAIPNDTAAAYFEGQLKAKGASDVVFIRELGLAFARFERIEDADGLRLMSEVAEVGPMRMYTVPGTPTPTEIATGGRERATALINERAARRVRPPATSAVPGGAPAFVQESDSLFAEQWALHRVHAPEVWARGTGSARTVVGVVDTGVATNHPDLQGKVVHAECFTLSSLMGRGPCRTYPTTEAHGTHVAGTIAARFGGGAAVGVGPDLALASYNVFEIAELWSDVNEDGEPDRILYPWASGVGVFAAVVAAVKNGDKVINLSLGSTYVSETANSEEARAAAEAWRRAARYANSRGSVLVTSAGNDGDLPGSYFGIPSMLGDLDSPYATSLPAEEGSVVTVAATGIRYSDEPGGASTDVNAYYSNFGRVVDIAAPGGDWGPNFDDPSYLVVNTVIELDPLWDSLMAALDGHSLPFADLPCVVAENCAPGYALYGGTSMAAPHVAGAIGLLVDAGRSPMTAAEVLKILSDPPIPGGKFGRGVLNVSRAMR